MQRLIFFVFLIYVNYFEHHINIINYVSGIAFAIHTIAMGTYSPETYSYYDIDDVT